MWPREIIQAACFVACWIASYPCASHKTAYNLGTFFSMQIRFHAFSLFLLFADFRFFWFRSPFVFSFQQEDLRKARTQIQTALSSLQILVGLILQQPASIYQI